MRKFLKDCLYSLARIAGANPRKRRPRPRPHLEIEGLESRLVPTVTYHGGALLPQVEVQALYYGSDWATPAYTQQRAYLDGFLQNVVHSTYMDMLSNAGYNVGRGSFSPGATDLANIKNSIAVDDSQIRSELQIDINNGTLLAPDSNRLYVVFVQQNVAVTFGWWDSVNTFLGYHAAFAGTDAHNQAADIHYAVIAYPRGDIGPNHVQNLSVPWLSDLNDMTLVTSHELAEAVTDPNVNYKTQGWVDGSGDEIGDITAFETVYLNGYAVQRISDQNDQSMTPAGATADRQVSFVLTSAGTLYEVSGAGMKLLGTNVLSISDQGIDNEGHPMVDVIRRDWEVIDSSDLPPGTPIQRVPVINAYEYHDGTGFGSGWQLLDTGVVSVVAGQGVSYVLYTGGAVYEYHDESLTQADSWTFVGANTSYAGISAGTDSIGVNAVDVLLTYNWAYQYSDSSGWKFLGNYIRSISAGQQGVVAYVTTSGNAYVLDQTTNTLTWLGGNVAQATAGTDEHGVFMVDLLYSSGDLYEYRPGSGSTFLHGNVRSIAKGHAGLVDAVFTSGDAYAHDAGGWHFLLSGAKAAA